MKNVNNYAGWEKPRYQALVARCLASCDPLVRRDLLVAAEALLAEEMPCIPLYHRCNVYLAGPRLDAKSLTHLTDFCISQLKLKHPL